MDMPVFDLKWVSVIRKMCGWISSSTVVKPAILLFKPQMFEYKISQVSPVAFGGCGV